MLFGVGTGLAYSKVWFPAVHQHDMIPYVRRVLGRGRCLSETGRRFNDYLNYLNSFDDGGRVDAMLSKLPLPIMHSSSRSLTLNSRHKEVKIYSHQTASSFPNFSYS